MGVALTSVGYFLNNYYCQFASDIKAYTAGSDFYYWGPKYCPATWTFKGVSEENLGKVNNGEDIVVIAKNESDELAGLLTQNYLDYSVYIAGEGEEEFVIYETECQKCQN